MHYCKIMMLLFGQHCCLMRMNSGSREVIPSVFDVAMGCYDATKVRELFGFYILHKLSLAFQQGNIGLYGDDGIAIF